MRLAVRLPRAMGNVAYWGGPLCTFGWLTKEENDYSSSFVLLMPSGGYLWRKVRSFGESMVYERHNLTVQGQKNTAAAKTMQERAAAEMQAWLKREGLTKEFESARSPRRDHFRYKGRGRKKSK